MRVAVGSILTECNQFGGSPINIQSFERKELRKGVDMLEVNTGVVGGTLQTFKENHQCCCLGASPQISPPSFSLSL